VRIIGSLRRVSALVSYPFWLPVSEVRRLTFLIPLGFALLGAAGCSAPPTVANLFTPFRLDIAQGNYLTEEALERVKPGMKRQDVRFALGSPLLSDPFHPNRWDYIFRFQKGNGEAISRRVTIYFEGELVTKVDADKLPGRDDPNDPALPRGRQR